MCVSMHKAVFIPHGCQPTSFEGAYLKGDMIILLLKKMKICLKGHLYNLFRDFSEKLRFQSYRPQEFKY